MRIGLRAGDLIGLNVGDLEVPGKAVHVVRGKGGKTRRVPITGDTLTVPNAWLEERERLDTADPALFVSLSRRSFGGRLSHPGLLELVSGDIGRLFPEEADESEASYRRLRTACSKLKNSVCVWIILSCFEVSTATRFGWATKVRRRKSFLARWGERTSSNLLLMRSTERVSRLISGLVMVCPREGCTAAQLTWRSALMMPAAS